MKMKKLNVQDFAKEELTKKQKIYVSGGHPTPPPPLPEDGEPIGGSTSSNGTIKDDIIPEPPIVAVLNL